LRKEAEVERNLFKENLSAEFQVQEVVKNKMVLSGLCVCLFVWSHLQKMRGTCTIWAMHLVRYSLCAANTLWIL